MVEKYNNDECDLAHVISQITSGIKNAIPEENDFILAKEVLFIENKLKENK